MTKVTAAPAATPAQSSSGEQPNVVHLTAEQIHALLDILTHHETYAETEGFKTADAVANYGFPFARTTQIPASVGNSRSATPTPFLNGKDKENRAKSDRIDSDDEAKQPAVQSTSPVLQTLLTGILLSFPGMENLPPSFWSVYMQGLLARFGEADLSESYDKGVMGTRKLLATGASSIVEMVARGVLGGVERRSKKKVEEGSDELPATSTEREGKQETSEKKLKEGEYDHSKAGDLERAWDDFVEELVYGDLVDEMFEHLAKTSDLDAHSSLVKAAADYAIIHLASFVHHTFIHLPEGRYLLKLIENINNLIPYKMLKQTLRIGNAATMINGLMRLLLAKLSVTSVTNWVGLTANPDDGMNLLQRIISAVLAWDMSEFRKGSGKIEKLKEGEGRPTEEMLQAIRKHVDASRREHDDLRAESLRNEQSIIATILNASDPDMASKISDIQHEKCLEYYSALLSARDRDAITTVLCRQPPDLFTHVVRGFLDAYDPMIRGVHSRMDLRKFVQEVQDLMTVLIQQGKPRKVVSTNSGGGEMEERMSSVEDYVLLIREQRGMIYGWLHSLANKCPDVWEHLRAWAKDVAVKFREPERDGSVAKSEKVKAKGLSEGLGNLFASLDQATQKPILAAIDAHASYLTSLSALSNTRLQQIADATSDSKLSPETSNNYSEKLGPGVYLARWHHLLDETLITPSEPPHKPSAVRHGRDVKHIMAMGKSSLAGGGGGEQKKGRGEETGNVEDQVPAAPDVRVVVKVLGEGFKGLVRERRAEIVA